MLKEIRMDVNSRKYINSIKQITLPNIDETLFISEYDGLTQLDIVFNILKTEIINNLTIVSFRIPQKSIDLIFDARKRGLIKNIEFYLSDSIPYMVKSTFFYLKKENVTYNNFHSKFTLIETECNNYLIQSTGNFHFEKDIEFTTVVNNKELYNNTKLWLEGIRK